MPKPVIVVTVSGGVAEFQIMPPGCTHLEVLHIDWDNLLNSGEVPDREEVEGLIERVKALPGTGKSAREYRNGLLTELKRALRLSLEGVSSE